MTRPESTLSNTRARGHSLSTQVRSAGRDAAQGVIVAGAVLGFAEHERGAETEHRLKHREHARKGVGVALDAEQGVERVDQQSA